MIQVADDNAAVLFSHRQVLLEMFCTVQLESDTS